MKNFIRKIIREETGEGLNPREVALFKMLNEKSKELKTKSKILEFIQGIIKYLSLDSSPQFYYSLWKANYQPSGDYSKISPEDFIGPKHLPQTLTPNSRASEFVRNKVPFRGSNMEGKWGVDKYGHDFYVVTSYNWYPIYLFKDGYWYKITYHYSIATSKQMNNAWDNNIEEDVIWATKDDMQKLMWGATHQQIMKDKVKNLLKSKENFISKKPKFAKNYVWYEANGGESPIKVRFKITDIREENDKAIIDVTIDDAGLRERGPSGIITNRMIPSNGGYLRGELPHITKEKVEKTVKNDILLNFKDYIGKHPSWSEMVGYDIETNPENFNIKFNFIHQKQ